MCASFPNTLDLAILHIHKLHRRWKQYPRRLHYVIGVDNNKADAKSPPPVIFTASRRQSFSCPKSTSSRQSVIFFTSQLHFFMWLTPWTTCGMDGWVGHVGWPIADGLTTKWSPNTHPASRLAQDRESSPAETSILTIMLRRQFSTCICKFSILGRLIRPGSARGRLQANPEQLFFCNTCNAP